MQRTVNNASPWWHRRKTHGRVSATFLPLQFMLERKSSAQILSGVIFPMTTVLAAPKGRFPLPDELNCEISLHVGHALIFRGQIFRGNLCLAIEAKRIGLFSL